jgi:8-amino-7-oxononanoate synthase
VDINVTEEHFNAWLDLPSSTSPNVTATSPPLRTIKLFSLNDYLGLSTHESLRQAAANAYLSYGNGPRSSALVAGYTCHHRDLETSLATLKSTEECLLFPTGFAANMAVLDSLALAEDVDIYSDELNHASIVDGARLAVRRRSHSNGSSNSSVKLHVYRHNDLGHLEELLLQHDNNNNHNNNTKKRKKVLITDSLFSMDGDYADLQGLVALKNRYGFLLAIDEAHATLCCGKERGAGAAEMFGVEHDIDLHIGTLSKAFGCMGGFVCCSNQWKHFFINRGRAQVFSTALPVPVVVAAQEALAISQREGWRREHLWRLIDRLGKELGVGVAVSPIVPVMMGSEDKALEASRELLRQGYHVPAIRPPTVPRGTCRLRISLSAGHTMEDVVGVARCLKPVMGSGGQPRL